MCFGLTDNFMKEETKLAKKFMDAILYDNDFVNRYSPFNEYVHYGNHTKKIAKTLVEPIKRLGIEFFTDEIIETLSVGEESEMSNIIEQNDLHKLNEALTHYYDYLESTDLKWLSWGCYNENIKKKEIIKKLIEYEQEEIEPELWGQKYPKFKPYLLEKKFGDGKLLMYFGNLDDRPYWWLVRGNSKWDINEVPDEDIYCAIEEECGGWIPDYDEELEVDEDGYDEYGECHMGDYPMIISDSSAHWGPIANFKTGECSYEIDIFVNKLLNNKE